MLLVALCQCDVADNSFSRAAFPLCLCRDPSVFIAGHFMGKKSATGSPHLEPPEEPAVPMVFGPSLRALLEDTMELLTRELLKILLQERLLYENQGKYDLTDQVNTG